jgi:hypothetical protein
VFHAHLAGAYTATLLVMVNVMKGGGHTPPPLRAWANFTFMMECTPESSRCYSVYSVGGMIGKGLAGIGDGRICLGNVGPNGGGGVGGG